MTLILIYYQLISILKINAADDNGKITISGLHFSLTLL